MKRPTTTLTLLIPRVTALSVCALLTGLVLAGWSAPSEPIPAEGDLHLELNLPARRLDVSTHGEILLSYPVAVGQAVFPTPIGSFEISRVVWNPWWYPPPSGWAAKKKITPPGPSNPMGRVKLYFKDLYFVHGTPDTESLGCAASHGCVRMANDDAIALARLVHRYGIPDADESEIERLVANPSSTRHVELDRPVPLDIVYRIAEVRNGQLHLHPDIYRRLGTNLTGEIVTVLEGAGYERDEIDELAVEALARNAPRPGDPTLSTNVEATLSHRDSRGSERSPP